MNPKTKKYLLIGGAVVAVAAIWWFLGRKKKGSDDAKTFTKITAPKGAIKKAIASKGISLKGKPVEQTTAQQ